MSNKLKSRKLWVFIALTLLIVGNYLFGLGMPPADVFYLVILGASYILGQGYVDAKQQLVQKFPVEDVTQSFTNIIQAELSKLDFAKNVPMDKILEAITPIMKQILGSLTFTLDTPKITVTNLDTQVDANVPTVQASDLQPSPDTQSQTL